MKKAPREKKHRSAGAQAPRSRTIDIGELSRGEIAYHFAPIGIGVHVGPESLGDLRGPLALLHALRALGPSEAVKRKILEVEGTLETNEFLHRAVPSSWPTEMRIETLKTLGRLREVLIKVLARVELIEKKVEAAGWRPDPKGGGLKRIRKGRGGDFLRLCIVSVYYSLGQGNEGNTLEVRKAIRNTLREFFPDELLDSGPDGNIYHAIYEATRRKTQ